MLFIFGHFSGYLIFDKAHDYKNHYLKAIYESPVKSIENHKAAGKQET